MKVFFYVSLLSVILVSCKKGKTLDHEVAVQFVTLTHSAVYPEGDFPPFDLNDLDEPVHRPNYAHSYSATEIASRFNSSLSSYLKKNKIMLQADTADYVLVITRMKLSEELKRESYVDSCKLDNPINYVYYSSLQFSVGAKLYQNGLLVGVFDEEGNSCDSVKSKTDDCNAPKIRHLVRSTYSLVDQVAKELRVRFSKKMMELEN